MPPTIHGGFLWLLSGIVEKRQTINFRESRWFKNRDRRLIDFEI